MKFRGWPAVLLPEGKKLNKPRAEFLADFNEGEEREKNIVAGIPLLFSFGDEFWQLINLINNDNIRYEDGIYNEAFAINHVFC